MTVTARAGRLAGACLLWTAAGIAGAERGASADPPAPPPCGAWEIEYSISANLELSDTPMKQGDGIYPIGPGDVVLRFDDQGGQPGGHVKMLTYSMRQAIRVVSKALFWTTTVSTDTTTRATPNPCGVSAEGTLAGSTLSWTGPVREVRSDGTMNCDGSLCGKFGAPPPGQSMLHIGPNPVQFQSFQFSHDLKTFTMPSTFVSKTDDPKQTAHVALAGRETRRSCVQVKSCM